MEHRLFTILKNEILDKLGSNTRILCICSGTNNCSLSYNLDKAIDAFKKSEGSKLFFEVIAICTSHDIEKQTWINGSFESQIRSKCKYYPNCNPETNLI